MFTKFHNLFNFSYKCTLYYKYQTLWNLYFLMQIDTKKLGIKLFKCNSFFVSWLYKIFPHNIFQTSRKVIIIIPFEILTQQKRFEKTSTYRPECAYKVNLICLANVVTRGRARLLMSLNPPLIRLWLTVTPLSLPQQIKAGSLCHFPFKNIPI